MTHHLLRRAGLYCKERNGQRSAVSDHMFTPFSCDLTWSLQKQHWPLYVILKREGSQGDEELRKYRPRSDFRISNSALPRLLVEVNSISTSRFPPDLIRMLITGAFIVRFANKFVRAFKERKGFRPLCYLCLERWQRKSLYPISASRNITR
jgi:hypothetical protein